MKKLYFYEFTQKSPLLFLMVFFFVAWNSENVLAGISVESYSHLTIQTIQQQIPQTQELISIVNQYKDNPEVLNQQLELKRTEFDQEREALYASFGTTAQEFVLYMNKNGKAVKAYLEANSDIKQQIDELSDQLNVILEEEDALRISLENSDELPLP